MNPLDRCTQLRKAFARRLDQQQALPRGLHLPFPAINGRHRARKDVDARGETRLHDGARDPSRFRTLEHVTRTTNLSVKTSSSPLLFLASCVFPNCS